MADKPELTCIVCGEKHEGYRTLFSTGADWFVAKGIYNALTCKGKCTEMFWQHPTQYLPIHPDKRHRYLVTNDTV